MITSAWKFSHGHLRLGTFARKLPLGHFRLESVAWELLLGAFECDMKLEKKGFFLVGGTAGGSWPKLHMDTSTFRELGELEAAGTIAWSFSYSAIQLVGTITCTLSIHLFDGIIQLLITFSAN